MVVSFTEWWAARLCGPCKCAPVCLQSHLQQRKNSRFLVTSPPLSIGAGLRRPGKVAPLSETHFLHSYIFHWTKTLSRVSSPCHFCILSPFMPAAQSKPQVVLQGYRGFFCFLQRQIYRNISGIEWNIFDIASKTQCGIILT